MSDIVAFLNARLEEDQAAIEAPESWTEGDEHRGLRRVEVDESFEWVVASTLSWRGSHIARHDPARVLREVKAKRAIVAQFPPWPPPEMTEQELHEHRAHPAYEYETTQGQRKAWDYSHVPPEGEGWERNVDAGNPGEGWERFDYHEESYWRRLRPEGPEPPYAPVVLRHLAAVYADHPDYDPTWAA